MTYEFFGSFMVFALIAYLRPSRLRTLLLAVLFLLLTAFCRLISRCSSPAS